jgi:DNA-binding NarL/FixJ family response regulator
VTSEIRVAIVEDQTATREGLATLINGTPGFRTTGSFGSMEEALPRLDHEPPDILLLDRHPELPVLMLTVYSDNDHVFEAICNGASGYMLKDTRPARLLDALRELHEGGAPMSPEVARKVVQMFQKVAPPRNADHRLSPRELQVLKLLAEGHGYKTAAAALDLAEDTIRFHVRHIYAKLHVHSKSEAVLKAFRSRIL